MGPACTGKGSKIIQHRCRQGKGERKSHYSHENGFSSREKKGCSPRKSPANPSVKLLRSPAPRGAREAVGMSGLLCRSRSPRRGWLEGGKEENQEGGGSHSQSFYFLNFGGFFLVLFLGKEPRGELPSQPCSEGLPQPPRLAP